MANATIPAWLQEQCNRLIENDEHLTNLNLNIRHLNIAHANVLSDAMVGNHCLCVLNLTSALVRSGSDVLQPLVQRVVPYTTNLRVLHLSYNRLVSVGGLGEAMAQNASIHELYLDYNALGFHEASRIAEGLSRNKTLRVLQLGHNEIGNEGCEAFAELLATNHTISRLGLDRNQISNVTSLMRVLRQSNPWIHAISLQQNENIPADQQRCIEYWLLTNRYGRGRARQPDFPITLWPQFLARIQETAPTFYFVHTTL